MYTLNNEIKPKCTVVSGKPKELGRQYGEKQYTIIRSNEGLLNWVGFGNNVRKSFSDPKFIKWMRRREEIIGDFCSDILGEIRGVAEATGMTYDDMLAINLRAWWYSSEELVRTWGLVPGVKNESSIVIPGDKEHSGAKRAGDTECTCLAATLDNGKIACGGALDDGIWIYCGPVKYCPENGYRYICFPIAGTIWGGMGINSEGLCLRSASGSMRRLDVATMQKDACDTDELNIDMVQGIILRTCRNVGEAWDVCQKLSFNGNMILVDADAEYLGIQGTPTGMKKVPMDGYQVITNHIVDDVAFYEMHVLDGSVECLCGPSNASRIRRGYAMDYLSKTSGRLSRDMLVNFLGTRKEFPDMSINNGHTIAVSYSEPQTWKNAIWFLQPQSGEYNDKFLRFDI